MGSATEELLAVRSEEELDAYLVGWKAKLGI
jgi:hypothetical protein